MLKEVIGFYDELEDFVDCHARYFLYEQSAVSEGGGISVNEELIAICF
jgi:hypothetical protein